MKESYTNSH